MDLQDSNNGCIDIIGFRCLCIVNIDRKHATWNHLFDPDSGETRAMRSKEDAHDYRYFPDPDLPPLVIGAEWVERVRAAMPELPAAMAARFERDDGLAADDALMMTSSLAMARYYEATRDVCGQPKLAANWLMGEVSRRLNASGLSIQQCPITPSELGDLISRLAAGAVSRPQAKQLFEHLWPEHIVIQLEGAHAQTSTGRVSALVESLGLTQLDDLDALLAIVNQVVAANPKSVEEYRAGKVKAFNALVGQVMKASKGRANPEQASTLLRSRLAP